MAWTLYLLVGISIMTSSGLKCKLTNSNSDTRRQYDYSNQEPLGIPDNGASARVNSRIAAAAISPANYPPSDTDARSFAQLRVGDATQIRRSESQNTDKIVFPGPSSEQFKVEIPDDCKKIGICQDVPNYPQDLANKVISQLSSTGVLQQDKLDMPTLPDIAQRVGPQEDTIELCKFREQILYPKAAVDATGEWHIVLNQEENPVQGYKVEICEPSIQSCSNIIITQRGYQTSCKQKFAYRRMTVLLPNGTSLEKSLRVPSCCACVANLALM